MKKIYAELARIQQELKAPKNLYNSFGKYSYRNAEGILEAVKPLLGGLALIINDEPVVIGERFYIKATVTLTDGEESVSAVAYAREDTEKKGMDGCQITGACSSYARKYALNALLMIDDAKDSDDDSLSPKNPANSKDTKPAPAKQSAPATVTTQATVPPPVAKPVPQEEQKPETPAAYIKRRIGEFKSQRADFDFKKSRASLIESGVVEDIPSAIMKMDQAVALMDAIEKNFMKKAG